MISAMKPCWTVAAAAFGLAIVIRAAAGEPGVTEADLPRVPPTEPDRALETIQVRKGFHVELAAAEPLVVDPIAMAFDEQGRLYVVEMRDYSERRPERLGRVRRLEDTDGDGRYDKSTVYVDGLPWPTAVFCYDGGVFVGATPDILYCKDTDGDGVADVREVVFSGFAGDYAPYETNRLNVQALMNSFNWGLDNRIHGSASMSGGRVAPVDSPFVREWIARAAQGPNAPAQPGATAAAHETPAPVRAPPADLRGRDFSFDPRTLDFRAESGGAQHGMSFDSRGRKFVCSNSDHIQLVMFEDRDGARNPWFAMPPARLSIAADGPAAEVYRISPDEPWRVIRTRWRVAGLVPGPVEGGGRPSGYFTGATGTTIYRGDAFPADDRENAFIADCGSNLVHRKKLAPDGAALVARRPDDEQKSEFLASRDNWFRPVQFANAPDGTLYIADMYREVIEHPWSLPQSIKRHLDLNSGNDRGRIYRVVPDGFRQPQRPRLDGATTTDLVAVLEHPNGWHRDTAARLLYERQDTAAVPALRALLNRSKSPLGRMHALYALHGLGRLDEAAERRALKDPDAIVRQHAARLAPAIFFRQSSLSRPWPELTRLADDPDTLVRYQLAFTLGEFHHPDALRALGRIVRRDPADRWVRVAALSSLKDGGGDLFRDLAADAAFVVYAGGREFLRELVSVLGAKKDPADVAAVLDFLRRHPDSGLAFLLTRALGDGLARAGGALSVVAPAGELRPVLERASAAAADPAAPVQTRVEAVELLAEAGGSGARDTLLALAGPDGPEPLQWAAATGLARLRDPSADAALLRRWSRLGGRVRGELVSALLTRPERTLALLQAVEERAVPAADFSAQQLQVLRHHRDPNIRARAVGLFGAPPEEKRDEVVAAFLPSLQLRGDPARGRKTYLERCAACHRSGSQGHAVGPDLATVKTAGKETLLVSILDPNREVAPRFLNYLADTTDGDSYSGILAGESPSSVTLHGPNGVETTLLRSQLVRLRASGQSLMPEGLELGLTQQDMADLLEYLGVAD